MDCSLQTFLDAVLTLELSTLPGEDIRSNGFFHGRLSRVEAEGLLPQDDGSFLVRESSSSTEKQYVLSCRSSASSPVPLHFLIHQCLEGDEKDHKKIKYAFDGDKFESIEALISFHVETKTPVTSTSCAVISKAVERQRPLNLRRLEKYYQNRPKWSLSRLLKNFDVSAAYSENFDENEEKVSSPETKNNVDFSSFSSPYLCQLQSGVSAISLEEQEENDDLISSIQHLQQSQMDDLFAYSNTALLATHLFKRNLRFFGLLKNGHLKRDKTSTNEEPFLHCALELLCLPGRLGRQIRRDAIVRHETLKYVVVLSILRSGKGSGGSEQQLLLLRKWLQVTERLLISLGDNFAFGAIMAGLRHPAIASLDGLWTSLRVGGCEEVLLYDTLFSGTFKSLQSGSAASQAGSTAIVVMPFVVQLSHLLECTAILSDQVMPLVQKGASLEEIISAEAASHQKVGLMDFSLDSILAHIELSASLLDQLPSMERRARADEKEFASYSFFHEPSLDELFKTTTLLRYLFGQEVSQIDKIGHEAFRRLEEQLSGHVLNEGKCDYDQLGLSSFE